MTGQDFQDKLAAIVADLQTRGKGQTVTIAFRNQNNTITNFSLSSDINGVVSAAQMSAVSDYIADNQLAAAADMLNDVSAPVDAAREAFKIAQAPHQALITAATAARGALQTALDADPVYRSAKTALDAAQNNPDYTTARENYRVGNISENFGNLSDAKGKYIV